MPHKFSRELCTKAVQFEINGYATESRINEIGELGKIDDDDDDYKKFIIELYNDLLTLNYNQVYIRAYESESQRALLKIQILSSQGKDDTPEFQNLALLYRMCDLWSRGDSFIFDD